MEYYFWNNLKFISMYWLFYFSPSDFSPYKIQAINQTVKTMLP